jgi:hypothetical protein
MCRETAHLLPPTPGRVSVEVQGDCINEISNVCEHLAYL